MDLGRLDIAHAVTADKVETLPDALGLYAIWCEDLFTSDGSVVDEYDTLLYVGMSSDPTKSRTRRTGIRSRVRGYLKGAAPNETLYVYIIDNIVRPNMRDDRRNIGEIAIAFLRDRCCFAGLPCDEVDDLVALERRVRTDVGVSGEIPMLNDPARVDPRRRRVEFWPKLKARTESRSPGRS
jgi:hypothetical protein